MGQANTRTCMLHDFNPRCSSLCHVCDLDQHPAVHVTLQGYVNKLSYKSNVAHAAAGPMNMYHLASSG